MLHDSFLSFIFLLEDDTYWFSFIAPSHHHNISAYRSGAYVSSKGLVYALLTA